MPQNHDFIRTMLTRRSVRHYTGEPVTREDMLAMIRAGMSAPSYKDKRDRYFIAIDDPSIVRELGEGLPFSKVVLEAKQIIVVASDPGILVGAEGTDYWVQGGALAAGFLMLAGHSLGIATCWTAAHPRAERAAFVRKVLGMPEHIQPLCVIAVGIPTGEDKPRDKFEPEKVFWNRWGEGERGA